MLAQKWDDRSARSDSNLSTWDELLFDNCGELVETTAFGHFGAIRGIKVDDAVTHIPEGLRFRIKPDYFSGAAGDGFKSFESGLIIIVSSVAHDEDSRF